MPPISLASKKLRNHWNRINKKVFKGQLHYPKEVEIEHLDTEWGAYIPEDEDLLMITNEFPNKIRFKHVLAHEMIHVWQWQIDQNPQCGHGSDFEYWIQTMIDDHGFDADTFEES